MDGNSLSRAFYDFWLFKGKSYIAAIVGVLYNSLMMEQGAWIIFLRNPIYAILLLSALNSPI